MSRSHGESNGRNKTKEYDCWTTIKGRCNNPKNAAFYNYGGRGIMMCDRWKNSYENFILDIGRAPSKNHSLDRIDNNGNYEPGNVRWATRVEQQNNTRTNVILQYKGELKPLSQLCRDLNLNRGRLKSRLYDGWTVEDAIEKPKGKSYKLSLDDKMLIMKLHSEGLTQRAIGKILNVDHMSVCYVINVSSKSLPPPPPQ